MTIHRPLNYIPDGVDKRDYKFNKRTFKKLTKNKRSKILGLLPKSIDHTENMTPVKDQGQLGSCVAFALVALKEWQEKQEFLKRLNEHMDQNPISDLSEQWVYHKAKDLDNISGEGTTLRTGLKVLKDFGVPLERSWAYNDNKRGSPKEEASEIAKMIKIGNFFKINTLSQMKLALLHTPVPIGIVTTESFFKTRDGVIEDGVRHQGKHGAHAICVVGYDDKEKLIKFKNSWSNAWGDNGYGYLTYDYFKKYCIVSWAVENANIPEKYVEKLKSL